MRKSEDIEDRRYIDETLDQGRDYNTVIEKNTAEMKKLNENFKLLDKGDVELRGLGGLPGFLQTQGGGVAGGGGGGGGGGGARPQGLLTPPGAPYGNSSGPGSGAGAGDSHPASGAGGGTDPAIPLKGGAGAGGTPRTYETRKGEKGEFNYAETGAFGKPGTNLTTVKLKNGQTVQVNAAGAEQFRGLFNDMIDRGYKINSIGGYNYRQKAGGGGLSEHSWGTAVDVNPGRNAFRGRTTDMPQDVEEMAWSHGVSWGGRFGDPMHFEIMSPEAAAHKKQILADRGLIDDASKDKSVRTVNVDSGGKLTAEVNAPRDAKVTVEGGGAFSKTETNRTMPLDGK
jgi:hypothetical protein